MDHDRLSSKVGLLPIEVAKEPSRYECAEERYWLTTPLASSIASWSVSLGSQHKDKEALNNKNYEAGDSV